MAEETFPNRIYGREKGFILKFTQKQEKVLQARHHNILVSAAAGSGKTAVLVERIIRLITEGEEPLDIDRLLVVTFTRAAAAQMRERIAAAISDRLEKEPMNEHLQMQETLLHRAQITTMDSFFTFLLHNHFSDIDLDPGFRQMDQTESDLLRSDVLERFLEEQFAEGGQTFEDCAAYFCPSADTRPLEDLIVKLYTAAMSHPYPEVWLEERRHDYNVQSEDELFEQSWMQEMLVSDFRKISEILERYEIMVHLSSIPGGPDPYANFLKEEKEDLSGLVSVLPSVCYFIADSETDSGSEGGRMSTSFYRDLYEKLSMVSGYSFRRLPSITAKKNPNVDPAARDRVKGIRDKVKTDFKTVLSKYRTEDISSVVDTMNRIAGPLNTLIDTVLGFMKAFEEEKKQKNAIDFADLEHDALNILVERKPDGTLLSRSAAGTYQTYFREILIDEYQDSNDVQEMILRAISGEGLGEPAAAPLKEAPERGSDENLERIDGQRIYNRFMVGDVKQSIYKFRMARPEIFMDKYARYQRDGLQTERIELDQNFRSRTEVLNSVNEIFARIMRREIGGIEYTDEISLKPGADYPAHTDGINRTELLLIEDSENEYDADRTTDSDRTPFTENDRTKVPNLLNAHQKEAIAIAHRIRDLVGKMPVRDGEDGKERPARYGDIVLLLRSGAVWNEEFRDIFEKFGIPCHVESRTGYFSSGEIRTVMQLLRVIDNPVQDIPLYGTLHGYFGGFTEDEAARVKAAFPDGNLYQALEKYAGAGPETVSYYSPDLSAKCRRFLEFLNRWRARAPFYSVHRLLTGIMDETLYENYCRVIPGGTQRMANLKMFINQASAFEKTSYHGLFQFIRYIDRMHHHDIDYGEANILDEHADVVRIMTIHKSKGLEFPICFVAGLSRAYSFGRHDASGALICDSDWGIGVNYMDSATRQRSSNLRKDCIASRIRRESLGEELRVLYVAMTRAEEKLILTGYLKSPESLENWRNEVSLTNENRLTVSMIENSGCCLDLIYRSLCLSGSADGHGNVDISRIDGHTLNLEDEQEQQQLGTRKEELLQLLNHSGTELPDKKEADLREKLDKALSWQYPHQNLQNLYTMTTVSELKQSQRLKRSWGVDDEESYPAVLPGWNMTLEPAVQDRGRTAAPTPSDENRAEKMTGLSQTGLGSFSLENRIRERTEMEEPPVISAGEQAGTLHGSCVHRLLEVFDFKNLGSGPDLTEEGLNQWVQTLFEIGKIPPEYRPYVHTTELIPFLHSSLAARMQKADAQGVLYREQPFILGVSAGELEPGFPEEETVLVQGIIDAFFEEDGEIVLVDYKTDRISKPEELIRRYRIQLDYYTRALQKILRRRVKERILYSFALRKEIHLELLDTRPDFTYGK